MNEPERKIFYLALALFALGLLYRYLPWEVPAISQRDSYSNLEYAVDSMPPPFYRHGPAPEVTDKLTKGDGGKKRERKGKKPGKTSKKPKLPIHINSAGLEDLCALKGVGPKLGEKILAYRAEKGPFSGPEDLEKVPGIGKKKLEGLLQGVIFD